MLLIGPVAEKSKILSVANGSREQKGNESGRQRRLAGSKSFQLVENKSL
jgi:hypothetical protein